MMMIVLMLVGGLLLLWLGGEGFVRGSVGVARVLGLSPFLIGLTLVGFGTSLPELVTSISAALADAPGLAVGNVVGSNIANVLLILGIGAIICPIGADPRSFRSDATVLAIASMAGAGLIQFGVISRLAGIMLVAGLVGYLAYVYFRERAQTTPAGVVLEHEAEAAEPVPMQWPMALLITVVGLAAVVGGATLFVEGAVSLAEWFGVSKTLIGLTLVAVGTSLPELVITIIAALRHQMDVVLGNIIGSNLFNILGIMGITALVLPIDVPDSLLSIDLAALLVSTTLLIIAAATKYSVSRGEGAILLLCYIGYTAYRATTNGAGI